MIKSDFHMHSIHSTDSKAPLDVQITSAISKGLDIICFTEHMDYDNRMYEQEELRQAYPGRENVFICDTDEYLNDFISIKNKYSDQIDVRFGIELGLKPHLTEHYIKYTNEYPFDFVIGSSHECQDMDPYYPAFLKDRDPVSAYKLYFAEELICAKACVESFDVYGHLDYALRYNRPANFVFNYSDYSDELDALLLYLIQNGKGIEINTSGYSYFGSNPNPHISILKRYKELGGEIITVGSDAHKPEDIGRRFDEAELLLKECGFNHYCSFKERKITFHKI